MIGVPDTYGAGGAADGDVAIVGVGCRLPGGADTPWQFWSLLHDGVDAVTEVPPGRFDPTDPALAAVPRWGGFVESIDCFDADFFGISPREARRMDPQQRLLLEVTWEALEDGGQRAGDLAGSGTGVFVGVSTHDYGNLQQSDAQRGHLDAYVGTGGAQSIIANRLSYLLDLHGPSLVVDTACSSSLTALHLAFRSLQRGECELALVGGTNAILTPEPSIIFSKASMLSPDGRCKPFDAAANGYVRSEGAGAVVLKPLHRALADGDPIWAVVRATGINQDGRTVGISVPNAQAQQRLLRRTLGEAGLDPADVQYVEAHGTGTPVGDPLEAAAIGAVYGAGRPAGQPCLIGSVKSNVGHLEAAAGLTGLVKTALALAHRRIPASLHFTRPNPDIPLAELGLRVPTEAEPWPGPPGTALAAVNAFGFGGANAHAILAEAPPRPPPPPDGDPALGVLVLSARSAAALRQLATAWVHRLGEDDTVSLRDLCHTAAVRRDHHQHRLAVVAAARQEAVTGLTAFLAGEPHPDVAAGRVAAAAPKLAFVLSGMGAHWEGMGRQLLREEPVFRKAVEDCDEVLVPLAGWSVMSSLAEDGASRLGEADRAHVVNLALQLGVTALLASWGITPDAFVGHSSGETGAAVASGALSLPDGVRLAFHRGRLLHAAAGTGTMLAAGISAGAAEALLAGREATVSLAAVNAPSSVTLSGDAAALEEVADELRAHGRWCRELAVDLPYHAPQLDQLEDPLRAALTELRPRAADVPLVSATTGSWADGLSLDADHWWRNLRRPVRFDAAIATLARGGHELFVEVSPHPVLTPSVVECLSGDDCAGSVLPTLRRGVDERRALMRSLAGLHVGGRDVDWREVLGRDGRCVRLPGYPWQRERHWFAPVAEPRAGAPGAPGLSTAEAGASSGAGTSRSPLLGRRLRTALPTWESDLGDLRVAYLDGHVVRGAATFPGAAHVVIALAAAREVAAADEQSVQLEDVQLLSLLQVTERGGVALQCVVDPSTGTLAIHSGSGTGEPSWKQRAAARLGSPHAPSGPLETADLTGMRDRCPHPVDVERFYRTAEGHLGLAYRGLFRSLTEIWHGADEALARVSPQAAPPEDGDPVHPALLDAAFQALIAAHGRGGAGAPGTTWLPISIGHVEWHRHPGASFWSHATVERRDDALLSGTVRLLDDDGRVVMTCRGIRFQPLDQGRRPSGEHLFEEVWEPAPVAPVSAITAGAPARVAPVVEAMLGDLAAATGFPRYYAQTEVGFNALAARLVRSALTELGADEDVWVRADHPELADELGVVERHHRYLARLVELTRAVDLTAVEDGADLEVDDGPEAQLVRATGERLAATLTGAEDPRAWLVAGDAGGALAAFYAATPSGRFYNTALAEAVAAAPPAGRRLRVLEVGAGTGATTAAVVDRLGDQIEDYLVTDVSPYFVKQARQRFGDRPGMRFAVADVEVPPSDPEARFDVVIAADVVHATADVRATLSNLRAQLAPGGIAVLLEPVRRSLGLELVFGQLAGWWGFTDTDVRPAHPLLAAAQWEQVLLDAGFSTVGSITDTAPDGGDPMQTVLVAQAPVDRPDGDADSGGRSWLVLADRGGMGQLVAAGLRQRGDRCTLVHRRRAGHSRSGGEDVELDPTSEQDWARLLSGAGEATRPPAVLHLWSLDAPAADDLDTAALMAAQDEVCGALVTMLRAAQRDGSTVGTIWLVTSGAVGAGPADRALSMAQTPLWGLGRVLRNERGGGCHLVDLDPGSASSGGHSEAAETLLAELSAEPSPGGRELALRGDQRFVRRVRTAALAPLARRRRARVTPATTFRVEMATPGVLETLRLSAAEPARLQPGQVEIRVVAAGLNFRDALLALGVLTEQAPQPRLGFDCAGIVTACEGVDDLHPGDEVVAFARGALASRVVADREFVVRKPPGVTFEEAATLPVAFVTAQESLHGMADLRTGERVLLHSATGGVGLAALQVCRRAGAEVFATAGTSDKRRHLTALGVEHVMDSRSLDFADEVREATHGEGIDVVLNTLVGAGREAGLRLLRPAGRFVDLSVRDMLEDAPMSLAPFARGLSYFSWGAAGSSFPAAWGRGLPEVVQDVADGALQPLPRTEFDIGEADAALRLLAQGRHIGKVVVTVHEPHYWVEQPPRASFPADATCLLVGGLGGFGLALAGWLVERGARHIVLTSRSGVPGPDEKAALEVLRASPAHITCLPVDAADRDAMHRLLRTIRADMPPLKGVVHAAMTLDDELLGRLEYDRFRAVLAPKVAGAWNLHQLTADDELDLFLLCSSASSVIGVPAQGSYAAANAFLDGLATHRRALGLAALTVNWGAVSDVGYVARHPELRESSRRAGIVTVSPAEAFAALERALSNEVCRLVVGRIDWSRWGTGGQRPGPHVPVAAVDDTAAGPPVRTAAGPDPADGQRPDVAPGAAGLVEALVRRTAIVLDTAPERVDPERPLTDIGLDSLMAVELQAILQRDLGIEVPLVDLLEGVTLVRLADRVGAMATAGRT